MMIKKLIDLPAAASTASPLEGSSSPTSSNVGRRISSPKSTNIRSVRFSSTTIPSLPEDHALLILTDDETDDDDEGCEGKFEERGFHENSNAFDNSMISISSSQNSDMSPTTDGFEEKSSFGSRQEDEIEQKNCLRQQRLRSSSTNSLDNELILLESMVSLITKTNLPNKEMKNIDQPRQQQQPLLSSSDDNGDAYMVCKKIIFFFFSEFRIKCRFVISRTFCCCRG
jgi:hypothetical protein